MSKTAAIPMNKEIQSFQFIFTGQQYKRIYKLGYNTFKERYSVCITHCLVLRGARYNEAQTAECVDNL